MRQSIVINREYGSGGREIGRLIADRAGVDFLDSRLLQDAATAKGLPEDLLASFDERAVSGQYFDLSIIAAADPETYALPYRMYGAIADAIIAAAKHGPAVFIGRCADHILAEAGIKRRSIFIYSTDRQAKIDRAIADGSDPRKAEGHVTRMDKSRRRYQQFFAGTNFGEPSLYDLCLNSGTLGYDACAQLILASVED